MLAWAQPLVEQFTSPTTGNLSRLAGAATEDDLSIVGPTRAVRIVAEATVVRPWFSRSSYEHAVPLTPGGAPLPDTVGLVPALLVVAGLVAALVTVAVAARRARRTAVATLATVAVVALVVEVVGLARSPVNPTGIAVHGMRWLWPVAALATAALVAALLALLRAHGPCSEYAFMPSADLRREGQAWMAKLVQLLDARLTLAQHREVLVLAGWLALLVGCVEYDTRT